MTVRRIQELAVPAGTAATARTAHTFTISLIQLLGVMMSSIPPFMVGICGVEKRGDAGEL